MGETDSLLAGGRDRPTVAWALVAVLFAAVAENLLDADVLWAGFALVAAGLAALPAVIQRDIEVMAPWTVVAVVALPVVARSLGSGLVVGLSTYLAVAALALVVAVELDEFTPVEMSPRFAVVFVVITTMSAAGTWAVVQFFADRAFGTGFLRTSDELMWDLVAATGMGVLAGVVFELYFHSHGAVAHDAGEGSA